mgnify:CR=1 FL=1
MAAGAYPPIVESHVEMDAAWALYEAYVKILTGEAETALVYGFGKSSAGELRRVLALQLDPYLQAPLWPDSVSIAAGLYLGLDVLGDGIVAREFVPRRYPYHDLGCWQLRKHPPAHERIICIYDRQQSTIFSHHAAHITDLPMLVNALQMNVSRKE